MDGRYLLDTNIVIALFADEVKVRDNLARADEVIIPAVVIGELRFGALKSGRPEPNLARIDELTASNVVVGCDVETAHRYSEVKNALRIKGRPIPENDIWIAAVTLQHHLCLATRGKHFNAIDGLSIAVW